MKSRGILPNAATVAKSKSAILGQMRSRSVESQDESPHGGNDGKAGQETLAVETYSPCQPDAISRAGLRKYGPASNELECESHIDP